MLVLKGASLPNRYSRRAEGLWRMRWHAHSLFSIVQCTDSEVFPMTWETIKLRIKKVRKNPFSEINQSGSLRKSRRRGKIGNRVLPPLHCDWSLYPINQVRQVTSCLWKILNQQWHCASYDTYTYHTQSSVRICSVCRLHCTDLHYTIVLSDIDVLCWLFVTGVQRENQNRSDWPEPVCSRSVQTSATEPRHCRSLHRSRR